MQGTEDDDLSAALDAVKKHRLASGMRCYGPGHNGPVFAICSETCRTALNWRALGSSILSSQRTIHDQ